MGEKHIAYFRLVDACRHTGCPVCACLDEDSRRALSSLLHESVTDVETRRRLRASWGLCNWHTWALLEGESVATGAAILYEDLLRVCQERLGRGAGGRPGWLTRLRRRVGIGRRTPAVAGSQLVAEYRGRATCPVCASLRSAEAHYVATAVQFVEDPQFSRAYRGSSGLCLPHVVLAAEGAPDSATLATVLDTTLAKWQDLRHDLQRLVSKHEYRNTESITRQEADSYARAFEVLAGRRHLFGTELHPAR